MSAAHRIPAKQPIVLLRLALPRSDPIHKAKDIQSRRITHIRLSVDIARQWRVAIPPTVSHAMQNTALPKAT
jgi:hypothetical protein